VRENARQLLLKLMQPASTPQVVSTLFTFLFISSTVLTAQTCYCQL